MVALENRFLKAKNGNIYSTTVCDYDFWKRYLDVFDEVVVFARVAEIEQDDLARQPANGSGVSFFELPSFIGPRKFLRYYIELKELAKESLSKADSYILRTPGIVPALLWHPLKKRAIPFGIEVVGNPLDSVETLGANFLLKLLLKWIFPKKLRQQCRDAVAAAYVSERYLQRQYPCNCWSTHYSSIELSDEAIIDKNKLIDFAKNNANEMNTFIICHVGSMSALYKSQDVLIEAVSLCRKKGFDIRLRLIGDGKYQNAFKSKAEELGVSEFVDFIGRVPPGQPVREFLDSSNLFVLSSLTEGLPRALIEAMARALPCIGSNVGGIKELLSEDDMVSPGDAEQLANKIMAVITNPVLMQEMATRNLEKSKEYRSSELRKRRIEFYKKVAGTSKRHIANI